MTREQLDLLIEYINLKARSCAREAVHKPLAGNPEDRLVALVEQLEETCE